MSFDDSKQPGILVVKQVGSSPPGELADDADRVSMSLVKQTRTRRLFNKWQLFALNLAMYGTWYVCGENVYFVLQNGGTQAWLSSFVIVAIGVTCQAASFAEMASIHPVAGAQYYWTHVYAPPSMKDCLTWMQGWTTWAGYVSMLASCFNTAAIRLTGIISLAYPDFVPTGWQTFLIIIAYLVLCTSVNIWAFRIVPYVELLSGLLNIVLCLVVLVVVWVLAPRNSADIFLQKSSGSGWDDFAAFNIGTLSNIWLFITFESTVHLGEETRNPRRAVPSGMFWGYVINAVMGLIMIITYGLGMPPAEVLLESVSPFTSIIHHATGSTTAALVILSILLFNGFIGNIGILSSVSRLTWAWARDGGLPKYFAIVDAKTRVPGRAVFGTSLLIVLLALLNLNDQAFIALGAVMSLSSLAVYVSYSIILACLIYHRLTVPGGFQLGEWNCGRFGLAVNVLALVYSVWEAVWLPFPALLPVTATNMNYAGPVYGLVLIFAVSYWLISGKRNWAGPNMKIVDIVLRSDDASK